MIQVGHVLCLVQHMWVQVDRVVVCDTIGGCMECYLSRLYPE